jgi:hypothetical protein
VLPHVAQFLSDILTPQEVSLSPAVIASNMAFAGLLTGVLGFADRLVSPVEAAVAAPGRRHFGTNVLDPKRRRVGLRKSVLIILALMAVAAVLQSFLTSGRGVLGPGGGFLFATLLASAVVLTGLAELAKYAVAHRRRLESRIEVKPAGVLIAGASVALSRALSLVPGLILGQAGGAKYEASGRSNAGWLAFAGLLAFGLVGALAWLASYAIPQSLTGSVGSHAQDFSLGLYLAAVQAIVFGVLPIHGAPGHALWRWNRLAWGLLALPAAFLLFHTMINPAGSFLDATQSANAPIYIALAGLICAVPALSDSGARPGALRTGEAGALGSAG